MKWLRNVGLLGVVLCFSGVVAQAAECADIVQQALANVQDACATTGRNQACYGNFALEATPRADVTDFTFAAQGDLVDVADVETLQLQGLNVEDNEWGIALMQLQADLPDILPGQNVTFLLFGDVQIENAVTADDRDLTPMQAFYFQTGIGELNCAEAPADGILIQTPAGVGEISLTMNEVEIQLGSTAYVQAQAGEEMTLSVIEGQATVTADGETVVVPEGAAVGVPLDESLSADGPPQDLEPYDRDALAALPIDVLPREIEIAVPANVDDIAAAQPGAGDMPDMGALSGMIDPGAFAGLDAATFCPMFSQMLEGTGYSIDEYIGLIEGMMGRIPAESRASLEEFVALLQSCE